MPDLDPVARVKIEVLTHNGHCNRESILWEKRFSPFPGLEALIPGAGRGIVGVRQTSQATSRSSKRIRPARSAMAVYMLAYKATLKV
jgi:hypothetical protein